MATNNERAEWGLVAAEAFASTTGLKIQDDGLETVVSDLIADLRHLCKREGISWKEMLSRAAMHYRAEEFGYED